MMNSKPSENWNTCLGSFFNLFHPDKLLEDPSSITRTPSQLSKRGWVQSFTAATHLNVFDCAGISQSVGRTESESLWNASSRSTLLADDDDHRHHHRHRHRCSDLFSLRSSKVTKWRFTSLHLTITHFCSLSQMAGPWLWLVCYCGNECVTKFMNEFYFRCHPRTTLFGGTTGCR